MMPIKPFFFILLLASCFVHFAIWLGHSFKLGWYPNIHTKLYSLEIPSIYFPLTWLALGLYLVLFMGLIFYLLRTTSKTSKTFKFLHTGPSFWSRFILTDLTTITFIDLGIPLTIFLAGALSPAIIETVSLLTLYLIGALAFKTVFTVKQYSIQIAWLVALIVSSSTFILIVNSQLNSTSVNIFNLSILFKPEIAIALIICSLTFIVHWLGVFFVGANLSEQSIFSRAANFLLTVQGYPKRRTFVLLAPWLTFYIWILFYDGAYFLMPESVAAKLTSTDYLVRFIIHHIFLLPLGIIIPIIIQLARNNAPIVIGLPNIMAMFLVLTFNNDNIHLTPTLAIATLALIVTAIGFIITKTKHEAHNA